MKHTIRRRRRRITACGMAAIVFAGCSGDARLPDAVQVEIVTTEAPAVPDPPVCTDADKALDPTRSYEPTQPLPAPGDMPVGSTMANIKDRGRLVVAVSGDTLQFGARDPITGGIEGFDIDILKEVNKAIFGGDPPAIEYQVITYAQRLPKLESHEVDLVAHTMTINCNRWLRIGFSSEYFAAGQKILVKLASGINDIASLSAQNGRICVPGGSTNLEEIQRPKPQYAGLQITEKPDITDCLVAFQQGQVDAITGDDTVLVGFAAQDPYAVVVGDQFTSEPYGVGANKDEVDLIQFVNSVLENIRTNGRWAEIYTKWVGGDVPEPPAAVYGRPLPGS
ncbi:MAG: glutamate ABC transporter substrate-binding protein [Ilumatobacteraceae bacterium]